MYSLAHIRREYLVFCSAGAALGLLVLWAQLPHGLVPALWAAGLVALANLLLATLAYVAKCRKFRRIQREMSLK